MRKILILLTSMFIILNINAQTINPNYDKVLADSLKGDEMGMKMYFMVILKTGSAKIDDKVLRDSLFAGHMANIRRLADMGKLVVAGPIEKNEKNYRGIFIFDVKERDELNLLLESDPTIKTKIFDTEIYQWYGSAAMLLVSKLHDKLHKQKF